MGEERKEIKKIKTKQMMRGGKRKERKAVTRLERRHTRKK